MGQHSVLRLVSIFGAVIAFILTCVINALSAAGNNPLFLSTQTNLSAKYDTTITPAGWTFSIWGVIYAWQALHLLYSAVSVFRKPQDDRLYVNPNPVGTLFYLGYIMSCLTNIGWIFCFDREQLTVSLIFLILIAVSLYFCVIYSMIHLHRVTNKMEKMGLKKDVWLVRILIQNGVAFYCAWTNVASLLNVVIVLDYTPVDVDPVVCAWIALGILNAIILVLFVLEVFVFDSYARYTVAHYATFIVALSGILYEQYAADTAYIYYLIFLLSLTALLGIIRLVLAIYRGCTMKNNYVV